VGAKESQESVAPQGLIVILGAKPRAFARGYHLSPLRGSNRMRFARYVRQHCLSSHRAELYARQNGAFEQDDSQVFATSDACLLTPQLILAKAVPAASPIDFGSYGCRSFNNKRTKRRMKKS